MASFPSLAAGTHDAVVDAQDAANVSLLQGGPQTSTNPVTLAGNLATYTSGFSLTVPVQLASPADVATDASGNVYISDAGLRAIRFMPASAGTYFGRAMRAWTMYTIAGTGANGDSGDGGPPAAATFPSPAGITVDVQGNVFIVDPAGNVVCGDTANHRVQVILRSAGSWYGAPAAAAGTIFTIAVTGATPFNGDNLPATGPGAARVQSPTGIPSTATTTSFSMPRATAGSGSWPEQRLRPTASRRRPSAMSTPSPARVSPASMATASRRQPPSSTPRRIFT
jgi:hypothetical protein